VLSFAGFDSDLDYLLVSNLLTRKLREAWVSKTDAFRASGRDEPRQWLSCWRKPTSCSTGRWPRKHLLDHRPRAAQVLRHTAGRRSATVTDLRRSHVAVGHAHQRLAWRRGHIHAVLSGLAGREALRGMLARLQPKEEVLLLGWASPCRCPSARAATTAPSGKNCWDGRRAKGGLKTWILIV